jgi:hypothetical protein
MSKLRVLTLISVLLLMVAAGCSSSDQGAIDKAVSATLAVAQPATTTATSTPEPVPTDTPVPEPTAAPVPTPTPEPTATPEPDVSIIFDKLIDLSVQITDPSSQRRRSVGGWRKSE